jgi:hypothetical protein
MSRDSLIAEIQSLWGDDPVEGWNIAYDVTAEIGLDAFTDAALEQIAARCRRECGSDVGTGGTPAEQMSFAL